MVCTAEGSMERDSSEPTEPLCPPRRSKPLHNFSLPQLKWGSQRQFRCVRIDSLSGHRSPSPAPRPEHSRPQWLSGGERRRTGDSFIPKLTIGGGGGGGGGGDGIEFDSEIKAVSDKFLIDLRAEMDQMRDKYLRQGPKGDAAAEQNPVGPWNLRTRRSACKAPTGGPDGEKSGARASHSPQRSDGGNGNQLKPSLRSGAEKKREERPKFCPTLKRKEVEDDFLRMTGQRLPRKPKKRPRSVQRQIDMLLPGFWLTEVSADMYKVPEISDNAKR